MLLSVDGSTSQQSGPRLVPSQQSGGYSNPPQERRPHVVPPLPSVGRNWPPHTLELE